MTGGDGDRHACTGRTSHVSSEPIDSNQADDSRPEAEPLFIRYAEIVAALVVIAMGVVILLESRDIRIPRALTVVGPRDFPRIIGAGLIVLGIWYAIDVVRHDPSAPSADSEDADPSLPTDWHVLGQLAIVLALYAGTIERLGFVIASSILFFGTAFALGSRHVVRDAAIGIVLSTATYLLFSEWLGIRLPAGVLDGVL